MRPSSWPYPEPAKYKGSAYLLAICSASNTAGCRISDSGPDAGSQDVTLAAHVTSGDQPNQLTFDSERESDMKQSIAVGLAQGMVTDLFSTMLDVRQRQARAFQRAAPRRLPC